MSDTTSERHPVAQPEQHQLAKFLVEIGPVAVFFLINTRAGIYWGTGAFMVATLAALIVSRVAFGRVPIMPLVSGFFVLVFGGLTLWLHDATFIKIKPTIVNLIFASALLGGLMFGVSLIKYVFESAMQLTDAGWRVLTLRWGCFFVVLAILNEIVWRNFSESFWLSFKVWGVMPLTLVFAVAQIGVISRHGIKPPAS